MADALVSPLLDQITTITSQQVQEHVKLVVGVDKEIDKLKSNLLTLQAVLEDADKRQIAESAVKDRLSKLKDICYDIDDVLDEWSIAIRKWKTKQEAEIETEPVPKETVCSFFRSPCCCFSEVIQRHDIALKIKEVSERLDGIAKEKDMYDFELFWATEEPERPISPTTEFVDVSSVHGRDDDKKKVVSMLLGASCSQEMGKVQAISIVGLGGIGKTTLAKLAYNDDKVKATFDKRMWVCVSDPFDQIRIAKAILESIGAASPNLVEFQSLVQKISESIEGKKFLLVLDDVWNQDPDKWEPLMLALDHGAPGSRILVTTHKDEVAKMIGSSLIRLSELSGKVCWLIFSQLAFYNRSNDERERLTDIGKEIAKKCKGLPLAAKVLGGLMQSKKTRIEWKNVLSSELWEIEQVEKLFLPLLLSYKDLPAAIKQCFTYCALLPKGCRFEKNELIQIWMAQGLLKLTSKEMEFVGEEYFEILAFRAFFQKFLDDHWSMHDIVHDFALFLAKNGNFTVDVNDISDKKVEPYEKVRHLSISTVSMEAPFPMSIYKAKTLRSLFINTKNPSIGAGLPQIFNNLTCLRSLNLKGYAVEELPNEIGKLIHLRYLNLAYCRKLRSLPETVSNLCNLQSLDLSSCVSLRKLPQGMIKLTELRHLLIVGSNIAFLPKGIQKLTSLRTLSEFPLCCDGGNENEAANLGEMKNMNHLGGHLRIRNLQCRADVSEVVAAELKSKELLIGLTLDFAENETGSQVKEDPLIEALQPQSELEILCISQYRGTSFPSWIMSLSMLTELTLDHCKNIEVLPPLGGLLYLETLILQGLNVRKLDAGFLRIETVEDVENGRSKQAAFPKLKNLTIRRMYHLEEWEGIGRRVQGKDFPKIIIMPELRNLRIACCSKLKVLPDYILAAPLEFLEMSESPILEQCYKKGTGKHWRKI